MGTKTRGVPFWFLPLLFLSVLAVYLLTLNSAFQPDDSAEIVSACVTLTTEHPSGYPLHVLLGHLAEGVPAGGVDFRANLLSALFGALGAVLLTVLMLGFLESQPTRPRGGRKAPEPSWSLFLALGTGAYALAFSKSYWLQALSAKGGIYQLQTCLFLGLLLCLQRLLKADSPSEKPIVLLAAFFIGIRFGIGSETQTILAASLLCLVLVLRWEKETRFRWSWKGIFHLGAILVLGASLLAVPPLLQKTGRPNIWPLADHWKGFRELVTNSSIHEEMSSTFLRRLLGEGSLDSQGAWAALWVQWDRFSSHLLLDLNGWFWIPLAAGILFLLSRKQHWVLVFGLAFTFFLAGALVVAVQWDPAELWCIDKFMLPINVLEALGTGLGLHYLLSLLWTGRKGMAVALACLGAGLSILTPMLRFAANDQSRQTWAYQYGADLMRSLRRNALFLAEGDNPLFSTLYFQKALGQRADVTLVPVFQFWTPAGMESLSAVWPGLFTQGAPFPPGTGERVRYCASRLIEATKGKRPIQVSPHFDLLYRHYFAGLPAVVGSRDLGTVLKPHGLLLEYSPGGTKGTDFGPEGFVHPLEGVAHATEAMDLLFADRAQSYLNAADYFRHGNNWVEAYRDYRSASGMALNPRIRSEAYRGLGDLFNQTGDLNQALAAYGDSIHSYPNREGYYQFIFLSARSGRVPEALEAAKSLARSYPLEPASWYKLAACQELSGEKEEAQDSFRKGLELKKAAP